MSRRLPWLIALGPVTGFCAHRAILTWRADPWLSALYVWLAVLGWYDYPHLFALLVEYVQLHGTPLARAAARGLIGG
jgi:hypothetical protein